MCVCVCVCVTPNNCKLIKVSAIIHHVYSSVHNAAMFILCTPSASCRGGGGLPTVLYKASYDGWWVLAAHAISNVIMVVSFHA